MATSPNVTSLSSRGSELTELGKGWDNFKTSFADPYHPDINPDGLLNMGLADNVRCVGIS
jgi:hypothetical protein